MVSFLPPIVVPRQFFGIDFPKWCKKEFNIGGIVIDLNWCIEWCPFCIYLMSFLHFLDGPDVRISIFLRIGVHGRWLSHNEDISCALLCHPTIDLIMNTSSLPASDFFNHGEAACPMSTAVQFESVRVNLLRDKVAQIDHIWRLSVDRADTLIEGEMFCWILGPILFCLLQSPTVALQLSHQEDKQSNKTCHENWMNKYCLFLLPCLKLK